MKFGQGFYDLNERRYHFDRAKFFANTNARKIYLGLPQWGTPEWKGIFYSKNASPKDFLSEYARLLDCVEVSSTFYSPVSDEQLINWKQTVGQDFRFLPKWPRLVTHDRSLVNCKNEIKTFVSKMELLEQNLGTTILQLPSSFTQEFNRELFYFLCEIPKGFPIAIEFRHSSWFEENRVYPRLEEYLAKNGFSMVCSDTPSMPQLCHYSFTGHHHIIRFGSDEQEASDKVRLKAWSEWLNSEGVKGNIYFVLHRPNNEFAPTLIPHFSQAASLRVQDHLEGAQKSLF